MNRPNNKNQYKAAQTEQHTEAQAEFRRSVTYDITNHHAIDDFVDILNQLETYTQKTKKK